jgi:hypothetical protein
MARIWMTKLYWDTCRASLSSGTAAPSLAQALKQNKKRFATTDSAMQRLLFICVSPFTIIVWPTSIQSVYLVGHKYNRVMAYNLPRPRKLTLSPREPDDRYMEE